MTWRTPGWVSSSGVAAGVVITSTGPNRPASAARSGVVSTTSPRKAVWMTRTPSPFTLHPSLVHLEHGQERLLWDLHRPHLFHPFLSFFLFLQQLPLPGDVAAIALGEHVLAERRNGFPGDDLLADGRLDDDLEQLAGDQLLELLRHLA